MIILKLRFFYLGYYQIDLDLNLNFIICKVLFEFVYYLNRNFFKVLESFILIFDILFHLIQFHHLNYLYVFINHQFIIIVISISISIVLSHFPIFIKCFFNLIPDLLLNFSITHFNFYNPIFIYYEWIFQVYLILNPKQVRYNQIVMTNHLFSQVIYYKIYQLLFLDFLSNFSFTHFHFNNP